MSNEFNQNQRSGQQQGGKAGSDVRTKQSDQGAARKNPDMPNSKTGINQGRRDESDKGGTSGGFSSNK